MYQQDYKVESVLPEGRHGKAVVSRFTITKSAAEFSRIRAAVQGRGAIPAGTYTKLEVGGELWMSDTPDEIRDHMGAIRNARGKVLVHGLGLGVVVIAMLRKTEVQHVTVVERDADVIALVAPHLHAAFGTERLQVVQADALKWKPPEGGYYNMVWSDIWPTICGDNVKSMRKLRRMYKNCAGWHGLWCEREVLRQHRESLFYERNRRAAFSPIGGFRPDEVVL